MSAFTLLRSGSDAPLGSTTWLMLNNLNAGGSGNTYIGHAITANINQDLELNIDYYLSSNISQKFSINLSDNLTCEIYSINLETSTCQ